MYNDPNDPHQIIQAGAAEEEDDPLPTPHGSLEDIVEAVDIPGQMRRPAMPCATEWLHSFIHNLHEVNNEAMDFFAEGMGGRIHTSNPHHPHSIEILYLMRAYAFFYKRQEVVQTMFHYIPPADVQGLSALLNPELDAMAEYYETGRHYLGESVMQMIWDGME